MGPRISNSILLVNLYVASVCCNTLWAKIAVGNSVVLSLRTQMFSGMRPHRKRM